MSSVLVHGACVSHPVGCLQLAATPFYASMLERTISRNTISAVVLGPWSVMYTSCLAPHRVPVASYITSLPAAIGNSGEHLHFFQHLIFFCLFIHSIVSLVQLKNINKDAY
jgi:uncharacterized membrane protein